MRYVRFALFLLLLAIAGPAAPGLGAEQESPSAASARLALLVEITGPIGPAAASFTRKAIETARKRSAEILILRMNTPGGLADSMRDIIQHILAAPLPVVGYVAPPGGRAASAGTYILYATHVAAMAPGTNVGAATPVQLGGGFPGLPGQDKDKKSKDGEDKDGDKETEKEKPKAPRNAMELKSVNDAVAYIRSLAELRGRNADWAEKAVREAASLPAHMALEQRVIDLVADDIDALLAALDGRTVRIGRAEQTLATKGLAIERLEPDFMTRALGVLANPNVALILMMIGIYGLIFELANPGSIGPGVVGVICLILGLYALNQLPIDYAGLALVLVGVGLMAAEAITPTFGVLGLGGVIAFIIGAAMLIDTEMPAYQVSWTVILGLAAVSGALLILLLGYMWRTQRHAVASGPTDLVGHSADVLDWSGRQGHVWTAGERWQAHSDSKLKRGEKVRVTSVDGLTLSVAPDRPGRAAANRPNKGD